MRRVHVREYYRKDYGKGIQTSEPVNSVYTEPKLLREFKEYVAECTNRGYLNLLDEYIRKSLGTLSKSTAQYIRSYFGLEGMSSKTIYGIHAKSKHSVNQIQRLLLTGIGKLWDNEERRQQLADIANGIEVEPVDVVTPPKKRRVRISHQRKAPIKESKPIGPKVEKRRKLLTEDDFALMFGMRKTPAKPKIPKLERIDFTRTTLSLIPGLLEIWDFEKNSDCNIHIITPALWKWQVWLICSHCGASSRQYPKKIAKMDCQCSECLTNLLK